MFDKYKSKCALCNNTCFKFNMIEKENTNDLICKNCLALFKKYNLYSNIQKYSIEEIKCSIEKQKSIKDIQLEEKIEESRKNEKERKEYNNTYYQDCYIKLNCISPKIDNMKTKKNFLKDLPELKFSNITSKTSMDTINTFVVIDTETTGLSPSTDELLEISAIKFINSEPTECMTTLLKPKKNISDEIQAINHITNEMVQSSPTVEYVIKDFSEFIKGFNIVGYNLEFDIKFLFKNGLDLFSEKRRFYDVLSICKKFFKDKYLVNYKLDTICSHLGIQRTNSHRATEDALVTGILFRDIGNSMKNKE